MLDMLFKKLPDGSFNVIFPSGEEFHEGEPVILDSNLQNVYYTLAEVDPMSMYFMDENEVVHRVDPPGINRDNPGDSEYVQGYLENKKMVDDAITILAQKFNIPPTEIALDRVIRYSNEFNGHIPDLERLLSSGEDSLGNGTYFHEGLPVIRAYIRNLGKFIPCGCCHYKGEDRDGIMLEETPLSLFEEQWQLILA
jgi:hypothetical protein